MRARSKPKEIEFIIWTGENLGQLQEFCGDHLLTPETVATPAGNVAIRTLEGWLWASVGDYIIKGIRGEFYPCKPDVFQDSYEVIYGE